MKYNKLIAVTNLANRLNAMLDATSRRKYKFKYEGKASPILARRGYGVLVDNRVIYFNTPVFTKLSAYLFVTS